MHAIFNLRAPQARQKVIALRRGLHGHLHFVGLLNRCLIRIVLFAAVAGSQIIDGSILKLSLVLHVVELSSTALGLE